MKLNQSILMPALLFSLPTWAGQAPLNFGYSENPGFQAIRQMAGCYLVDYNFTETEALLPGYALDRRIYDVNQTQTVKEWIYADELGPNRIRLQHILFAVDASGQVDPSSLLKHQAEDWEFESPTLFEFVGPGRWVNQTQQDPSNQWTRRITNLDDGLRYQCSAPWIHQSGLAEWTCDNFAPIPGRETRPPMSRKDYNTLKRSTRLMIYGAEEKGHWLERQTNIKTRTTASEKVDLAREAGKTWYIRLPASECDGAKTFAETRKPFWNLLRETWDEVFANTPGEFIEVSAPNMPPRFVAMGIVEGKYQLQDLSDSKIRNDAKKDIQEVISKYRK